MSRTERVLSALRIKCRSSESRFLTSLRTFRTLINGNDDLEVTPGSDLTFNSTEYILSGVQGAGALSPSGQSPQREKSRLASDSSTAAVWSDDDGHRVSPMPALQEGVTEAGIDLNLTEQSQVLPILRGRDQEPFFIYDEFVRLRTRFNTYESDNRAYSDAVGEESPVAEKLLKKL